MRGSQRGLARKRGGLLGLGPVLRAKIGLHQAVQQLMTLSISGLLQLQNLGGVLGRAVVGGLHRRRPPAVQVGAAVRSGCQPRLQGGLVLVPLRQSLRYQQRVLLMGPLRFLDGGGLGVDGLAERNQAASKALCFVLQLPLNLLSLCPRCAQGLVQLDDPGLGFALRLARGVGAGVSRLCCGLAHALDTGGVLRALVCKGLVQALHLSPQQRPFLPGPFGQRFGFGLGGRELTVELRQLVARLRPGVAQCLPRQGQLAADLRECCLQLQAFGKRGLQPKLEVL